MEVLKQKIVYYKNVFIVHEEWNDRVGDFLIQRKDGGDGSIVNGLPRQSELLLPYHTYNEMNYY